MTNEIKRDTQIGWIYEGAKALVNREDYLLGKRLDKNFEMYSDTVVKEKKSGIDALLEGRTRYSEATTSKISNLGVNIVRNEDPLVAIKDSTVVSERGDTVVPERDGIMAPKRTDIVLAERDDTVVPERGGIVVPEGDGIVVLGRDGIMLPEWDGIIGSKGNGIVVKEEKLRQEKLENPLMMLKIQRLLKEAMEKKARKMKKKEKKMKRNKKERKKSTNSNSDSEHHSRKREKSKHSHKHHNERRSTSSSKERKRKRHSSNTSNEMVAEPHSSRHEEDSDAKRRTTESRHRPATSSSLEVAHTSSARRERQLDSHIPENLRPQYDHSSNSGSSKSPSPRRIFHEEEEKPSRFEGYGLVGVKKKEKSDAEKNVNNPYELARFKTTVEPYKKEGRRKLTQEEMEAKRQEMIRNAKWRDAVRTKNVTRAKHLDEIEHKKEHTKAADFIR
uniref:Pre-mRNA-splicing factor CWC25 homolog n=1 Tax=Ascaris lumbricoides TaxID=6252 RepID=A0A0M3I2B7_ASCLU